MNTEMASQIQAAFAEMFKSPDQKGIQHLMDAFEAFVMTFANLKSENDQQRTEMKAEIKTLMQEVRQKIAITINGVDGKAPIAGIDYPSAQQIAVMIEAIRPHTPIAGVDYVIPTKEEIVAACMAMMDTMDMSATMFKAPANIVTAINAADNQIKPERIEGLMQLIDEIRKKTVSHFYGGTGGGAAQLIPTAWKTPTESPDGVITAFTVSVGVSLPVDVVADGITMYSGAGYTYASGQITFTNPPTQYVRYR